MKIWYTAVRSNAQCLTLIAFIFQEESGMENSIEKLICSYAGVENVSRKIAVETGKTEYLSGVMTKQLAKAHEDLYPVISAWLKDEYTGFEYKGITLDMIMEKEGSKYIEAIFSMNALICNLELSNHYPSLEFERCGFCYIENAG